VDQPTRNVSTGCGGVFDLALMGESGKKREETGSAELTRVLGQRPKKNGPKTI